uniref:V-type proton ATPase subunit G n=1 Tax=Corethron hystrix TaxID=216773 RepID=A0A7S1BUJ2_9STRA|mmetsp:Transcript_4167/g.8058  ORF Transcript_4167/g.8058 Transcript_4167/m.8058 type:complete len:125 (+) Transcript_4167:212-586(+)|eukprot:CAMPEP_0113298276 /NCGR_PEP_ID=MMETSP0010_2-20120614/790_1 /TAXON_ID=216773 ORGANISM="Corethron hystrix, Strain 308" /NCGR_SAMPLE_ID=MMETSP0010_2 /ASSEMBLY_ACC=CAM_ASM_000155 /LENGTH=124 /DNA_ID=CAMNT_0000151307 /DNA_START=137 /DNA_END=511 /DNA_ORIENTATION=+ /assembly_acc=CAM_ASM_000155
MNNSSGIQELMAAETRASQIVAEARIGRGERMKQAKSDAQELIDAYRGEKQEEFNARVLTAGGSGGSYSAKLQAETNQEIKMMEMQFTQNAQKAIDVLLSKCCEVDLSVPTARVRATQKEYGSA